MLVDQIGQFRQSALLRVAIEGGGIVRKTISGTLPPLAIRTLSFLISSERGTGTNSILMLLGVPKLSWMYLVR